MEPKAVKTGCVDVPSSSASVFAVSLPIPFSRTTRSAAAVISSFVNLFFGAKCSTLSVFIAHHSMYIDNYILVTRNCQ